MSHVHLPVQNAIFISTFPIKGCISHVLITCHGYSYRVIRGLIGIRFAYQLLFSIKAENSVINLIYKKMKRTVCYGVKTFIGIIKNYSLNTKYAFIKLY